jgi:hypothetical protein
LLEAVHPHPNEHRPLYTEMTLALDRDLPQMEEDSGKMMEFNAS